MLITKRAKVKWNPHNKKHYEDRGYEYTKYSDEFEAHVEHITKSVPVEVKCDYCNSVFGLKSQFEYRKRRYRNKNIIKDTCNDCTFIKRKESSFMKFGENIVEFIVNYYLNNKNNNGDIPCVYALRVRSKNKYYIGSTSKVLDRFNKHLNFLSYNMHDCKDLQSDYNTYGKDDIDFYIIKTVENVNDLRYLETEIISTYDTCDIYNKRIKDSDSNYGIKWDEHVRNRMSNSQKGRKASEETKAKMSKARLGMKLSEESKNKLRLSHRGSLSSNSKLNDDDVEKIKIKIVNKEPLIEIAEIFNVKKKTINDIKSLQTWTHIREDLNDEIKKVDYESYKGEKNGSSKLTESKVSEIKTLLSESNLTMTSIADKYGVSRTLISYIKSGKLWSHVS